MNWYKTSQNQPIISFDFDNTIFKLEWDKENNDYIRDEQGNLIGTLNEQIKQMMEHYVSKGCKIVIVTSRQENMNAEVEDLVAKYNLPISEIYYTNGQDKILKLKEIGASKHFDDDRFEIDAINRDGSLIGILI